jgi:hypothetical protein
MELSDKRCAPCRGGVPVMGAEEAGRLVSQVSGWTLEEETTGKRCKRIPSSPRPFSHGDLRAVPSNAQDEGEEEPDGAGSTPGSPAPMLNPAST